MKLLTKIFVVPAIACLSLFISIKTFGQAPCISYSPSTATLTAGTAMTAMTPANSGGTVASLSYGSGTSITGGSLDHPYGVAIDASGNVYVANYGWNKSDPGSVSEYNTTTHTWSTFTTNTIANPSGIAIDNSGNVFVLNYQRTNNGNGNNNGNAYVSEYNSSGTYLNTIVQGLGTANGISINSTNGNLDVAEGSYNSGNTNISEYTAAGALNFTVSNVNISNPVNVATDNSGNIYVLNNTLNKVVKYSSTGTYIATIVSLGLINPYGIYVDGAGNIYVSDATGGINTIDIYNSSGTFLTSISGLTDAEGTATDSKGDLFVTDFTNNTLTEYIPKGGYFISGKLPPGLSFNYLTGTISGTPTTAFNATTYTITAYNGSGSSSTTVTLSCNPNPLLPTISYSPPVNVYTINANITALAPTVTNSPTSYSISGTLPTGLSFNTSTGHITGKPTAVLSATLYTITATNAAGSGTTTISIATVQADYWIGFTSTDWKTGSNWSTGSPPTSTGYASIGEQAYTGAKKEPAISSTEAITVGYLTFGATHTPTLTVTAGATGGTLTVSNILTIDDNSAPTIAGTGNVNMASSSVVNVTGAGVLTINQGLTFTLLSDATGSAAVDQISTGSIQGPVSVQRYLSAQRGYRLLASPVNYWGVADANSNLIYSLNYVQSSAYITGSSGGGFDKTGNPTLYLYREDLPVNNNYFTSGNYRGISSLLLTGAYYSLNNEASTYTIPASNGFLFFFRGNKADGTVTQETKTSWSATTATMTTTGYLNQGQIIFRDWYTPSSTAPGFSNSSSSIKGFNLAANPYACTIDLDTYNTTTTTSGVYASNISKFIYELNPKTSNYDTYKANTAGLIYTNNGGRYIASGQGFFVQATATGGELIFNETAKYALQQVTSPQLLLALKKPLAPVNIQDNPTQFLRVEMALDTVNKDNIMVIFDSHAKPDFVFNEDAVHITGSGKLSLSSISGDNMPLSINELPLHDGLIIPLKIDVSAYGTYTMNLNDVQGVPQVYDIWLKDAFKKDSVNMRTTTSYTFSVVADTSSYGSKRFSIAMRVNPAKAYRLLSFNGQISGPHVVQLSWTTENEAVYTDFNVQRSNDGGKTFTTVGTLTSSGQGSYGLVDRHALNGDNIYVLKSVYLDSLVTFSSPVDIQFHDNINGNVMCYPNPAGNNVNLNILNQPQVDTTYDIRITNATGLVVRHATTSDTHWQSAISDLLPGAYLVQVTDAKKNEFIGQTKFVKY